MWTYGNFDTVMATPELCEDFNYEGSSNPPAVDQSAFASSSTSQMPLGDDYNIGGIAWDPASKPDVYDGLLPEMMSPSPITLDSNEDEEVLRDIQQFFDKAWFIFPLLSYESIRSQLNTRPASKANPQFRCLLLTIRLANATVEHRMTSAHSATLLGLIRRIEICRHDYDFAEPPTLDDVVTSTVLFVAYNIMEKHVRAFLFLDEAISLLEEVNPVGEAEFLRKQLIQQVLYNTEAASVAIYAHGRRGRRMKKPVKLIDKLPTSSSTDGSVTQFDRLAFQLLNKLSQIHLANDAEELQTTNTNHLEGDLKTLFDVSLQQHQFCRIQAADVAVTHQWQLSQKAVLGRARGLPVSRPSLQEVEDLGLTAMAWVCSLKEGELRIVGLGKLAGLARAIHTIAGNNCCDYAIAGLVGAVMKEDHDHQFTSELAEVIMPRLSVPLPIEGPLQNDYANNRLRAHQYPADGQIWPLNDGW
ncbi:hypothetical protein PV08_02730 [Exophiala spinifera]|uniref:Transcription factor domain-containing protein n=1 Tax=Exophiala spinifera TaxID=91928 RepID=A0A0D2A0D1_9EURO|nr:uncharacterized protein PV08_02730 [Exophiala spinifera]KIW18442.1 hypothetical protein PV08_02730 [Exophiala spinifera]